MTAQGRIMQETATELPVDLASSSNFKSTGCWDNSIESVTDSTTDSTPCSTTSSSRDLLDSQRFTQDLEQGFSTTPTIPASGPVAKKSLLNAKELLSMERTLFSSMQVWVVVAVFAGGLLMTDAKDDNRPNTCGLAFMFVAVLGIFLSWVMHVVRLILLEKGNDIGALSSAVWTFLIICVVVSAAGFELYFAVLYPYYDRLSEVSMQNSSP